MKLLKIELLWSLGNYIPALVKPLCYLARFYNHSEL